MKTCLVSVDVEEDLGARTFLGVENLDGALSIFEKFGIEATLFVTGEVLEKYPDMIREWSRKHEIACHGYHHTPLHELSARERERQLVDFSALYQKTLGRKPNGFRAVENTIDDDQLRLLETYEFAYDSSVVPRYVPFRKYVGYKGKAPMKPYHPSYENYRDRGQMKILEIPNTPLVFGVALVGTWLRVFGPGFYRVLLALKKPAFVSLLVHSWDVVQYEGPCSRNSGSRFHPILEEVLSQLKDCNYRFASGRRVTEGPWC